MKKLAVFLIVACLLFVGGGAFARMDTKILKEKANLTVEQLFLNQVDTVALYLSTPDIVYVPRLNREEKLFVELVFLNRSLGGKKDELKQLAMRHINTFTKTLKERLEIYTPTLAKVFDPKKDVAFNIQVGAKKELLAVWQEGDWLWTKVIETAAAPKTAVAAPQPVLAKEAPAASTETGCKKKCPALRIPKAKEVKEPVQKTEAQKAPQPQTQPKTAPAATTPEKPAERENQSQIQKL